MEHENRIQICALTVSFVYRFISIHFSLFCSVLLSLRRISLIAIDIQQSRHSMRVLNQLYIICIKHAVINKHEYSFDIYRNLRHLNEIRDI